MCTLVGLAESRGAPEKQLAKPLDEAVWQAWVAKGHAQERRNNAARVKAVKWVSIAGLLATAGLWSYLTAHEAVIRLIVAVGTVVVMFQAFQARRYTSAAVFGGLALLCNPLVPVFSFSGDWQRTFLVVSAVLLAGSLTWPNTRLAQ